MDERVRRDARFCWPHVLSRDTSNEDFKAALAAAENAGNANNTSIILRYSVEDSCSFLFMGDMETDMIEKIEDDVNWPSIDVLFAPHHGRSSATVPSSILHKMDPESLVLGEAPSQHLQYYPGYNTISQNSAKNIVFEADTGWVHIYSSNQNYSVNFLVNLQRDPYKGCRYIGSLEV
ncbi:MAG: hypothetical protein U5K38_14310 [Woeseiaceae bacterium]|nr:hypothetical protein [Woeseiaceae bacterium]